MAGGQSALGDRRELDGVAFGPALHLVADRGFEQSREPGLELLDLRLGSSLAAPARCAAARRGAFERPRRQRVESLTGRRGARTEPEEAAHLEQSPGGLTAGAGELDGTVDRKRLGGLVDQIRGGATIGQHRAVDHHGDLARAEQRVGAQVGEDRAEIGGAPEALDADAVGSGDRRPRCAAPPLRPAPAHR